MGVTPAEPLCNRTAKFAFEFNKICAVFLTDFYATANTDGSAFTTDQLLLFEVLVVVTALAGFHTTEVGNAALEALVIREHVQRVPFHVSVIVIVWVQNSLIFMQLFKFSSFHGPSNNVVQKLQRLFHHLSQFGVMWSWDLLFAFWAVKMVKDDSRPVPTFFNLLFNTFVMEHVSTIEENAGFLTKACNKANTAKVLFGLSEFLVSRHFGNAFWL